MRAKKKDLASTDGKSAPKRLKITVEEHTQDDSEQVAVKTLDELLQEWPNKEEVITHKTSEAEVPDETESEEREESVPAISPIEPAEPLGAGSGSGLMSTPSRPLETSRARRTARRVSISAFILFLLFIVAGGVYTWYGDQKISPQVLASAPVAATTVKPVTAPKPAKNIPESVAIDLLQTPIHPGDDTEMSVRTNPASTCTITVEYNKIPYKNPALSPKTADDFGTVSWSWTVGKSTPIGDWPVTVTCALNGKTGVVKGTLSVF